jgi:prepilin-type processing-associated H-X9-DG protein
VRRLGSAILVGLVLLLTLLFYFCFCRGYLLSRGDRRYVKTLVSYCSNRFKAIWLGLSNYADEFGTLPPAYFHGPTGDKHSWRVLLLPYMECWKEYGQYRFGEPWNSDANMSVCCSVAKRHVYRCMAAVRKDPSEYLETNYMLLIGKGTAYSAGGSLDMKHVTDGLGCTILGAEVCRTGVVWSQPQDLEACSMPRTINAHSANCISSYHPGGANVLFCDGSVAFLSDRIDARVLEALITARSNDAVTVMQGKVIDTHGNAVEDARIEIVHDAVAGSPGRLVRTRDGGLFRVIFVHPPVSGLMCVRVCRPGYVQKEFTVKAGKLHTDLTIVLSRSSK